MDKINKIMEVLYEKPEKRFTVREIAMESKVPRATVHVILSDLKKKGLIMDDNSVKDSFLFRIKKINYFIEKLAESGLLEEIVEKLNPGCIILFGSIRKGDSVKDSDIDLFVESFVKKKIKLDKFEKYMGHKIQLFVESNVNNLNKTLFNNVVNGIKLYGSFRVK